ncbi:bud site selection protein [Irineochytrium annulatum]|nr:bud site selection protein [Irineochytrium annulatum]
MSHDQDLNDTLNGNGTDNSGKMDEAKSKKAYLIEHYLSVDAPPGATSALSKKPKKRKKLISGSTIVSHSTKIIDDESALDERWTSAADPLLGGAKRRRRGGEDDDELRPQVVTGLKEEEKFKSDSWSVIRDAPAPVNGNDEGGEGGNGALLSNGAPSGLQTAAQVLKHLEKKRAEEAAALDGLPSHLSGKGAATVVRDRHGRRVDPEAERAKEQEAVDLKKAEEEKRLRFRRGLAQEREKEERMRRMEQERKSGFAVYVDDEERNEAMKERDRWGDPMAGLTKKDEGGAGGKKGGTKMKYKGPPGPPNRFKIPPGYRWDGIDRGNGFESKLVQARYSRQVFAEEAHKWSTEVM